MKMLGFFTSTRGKLQQILKSVDPFKHYSHYQKPSLCLPDFSPVRLLLCSYGKLSWKAIAGILHTIRPYVVGLVVSHSET